ERLPRARGPSGLERGRPDRRTRLARLRGERRPAEPPRARARALEDDGEPDLEEPGLARPARGHAVTAHARALAIRSTIAPTSDATAQSTAGQSPYGSRSTGWMPAPAAPTTST